ncbi:MAG: murein biosynthesis integral membrane protein MurJ [Candidatus Eisenbacteria bacterium]|nr:murein biosynthesis integral membrane protein MurJ [Candidatus Eisenbacteria bacterium]
MSRHAALVATGILLSRIAGLVRDRVFAHYFGSSDAADAFRAAFRIPNFLQNLFGEGVLSASFIPAYSNLLAREEREEADRVASAVFCLLSLTISCLVLIGVLATPFLIDAIAPGFKGAKRELTISLVRILFPGSGLLALSAWCLGILNSHRKFFISYTAPVAWNLVMIASLVGFGRHLEQFPLTRALAWGSVVGSALQVGVQLPQVARLMGRFRVGLGLKMESVRSVIRNFIPVFIGRGVVQISAYVDSLLASLLPTGALAGLVYAQTLYTLPVSLFGMSVSASELPALSSFLGEADEVNAYLRNRLNAGLRQIAFLVIPSAMAFLSLGDVIAGAIYQTGQFGRSDSVYVWAILAGSAVGLLATTLGRLYASVYYALKDTRTPLRYAVIRVLLTAVSGYAFSMALPPLLGVNPRWGVVGLTASAGLCGWLELALLQNTLDGRIGKTGLARSFIAKLWVSAGVGAAAGWAGKLLMSHGHPIVVGLVSLGLYGVVYFGMATALRVPEASGSIKKAVEFAGLRRGPGDGERK